MSRQLLINSKDRLNGTSTNFEAKVSGYQTNNNTSTPSKIQLIGIEFSNAIYTVNTFNNSISFFETTGTNVTIVLPSQIYTISALATQLATSMTSASLVSNTYTASYSSTTLKMTITANTKTFKYNADYPVLGFTSSQSAALVLTSTNIPKINIDYLIVQTNFAPNIISTSNVQGSYIVPLGNCSPGNSIFIGKSELPKTVLDFNHNYVMKFVLYDPNGNQIDNNNMDIIFMYEII
jgi:hypothetical protein